MKPFVVTLAVFGCLFVSASSDEKIEGQVGATCWSQVSVIKGVQNVCFNAPREFYGGINMISAKAQTVQKCETANALDYGDGKCFPQCKTQTFCVYGDSQ